MNIPVIFEDIHMEAMVDTGAQISLITEQAVHKIPHVLQPWRGPAIIGVAGSREKPKYLAKSWLKVGDKKIWIEMPTTPATHFDMILGLDILIQLDTVIDCKKKNIKIATKYNFPWNHGNTASLDYQCGFKRLHNDAKIPIRATDGAVGYDIYSLE